MKKLIFLCIAALLAAGSSDACITCNRQIREAIFDSRFYPNLGIMLSAFFVLAAITIIFTRLATKRYQRQQAANAGSGALSAVPLSAAAAVLGMGMGGFADGIVLHQILQWHEMLSAKIPPDTLVAKSVNMFWDGIFHAFTLITTLVGIYLLWQLLKRTDINRSGYLLSGGMLGGWGLFNLVEGIIDHHILELHHVRELSGAQDAWNYGFLGFGVLLLAGGGALMKHGMRESLPNQNHRSGRLT
jgi:uncharacterized membrane protein